MTDKKLEEYWEIVHHDPTDRNGWDVDVTRYYTDPIKQERNKALDQLEADVKDTVTIFSETVPADPEWLPLSLLLKAIKKLKSEA